MAKTDLENEVKFPIRDLTAVACHLSEQGAVITAARVYEVNMRFDTPEGTLTRERRVLRLRQDAGAVMTYKGPAQLEDGISSRQEIEFQVSDFSAAHRLLIALGYQVSVVYEKYRTTYALDDLTVVLDEMPFGNFVEIEGPDADTICAVAGRLGLNWEARSTSSYLGLFDALKTTLGLEIKNLSFAEFKNITVKIEDMDLKYAD